MRVPSDVCGLLLAVSCPRHISWPVPTGVGGCACNQRPGRRACQRRSRGLSQLQASTLYHKHALDYLLASCHWELRQQAERRGESTRCAQDVKQKRQVCLLDLPPCQQVIVGLGPSQGAAHSRRHHQNRSHAVQVPAQAEEDRKGTLVTLLGCQTVHFANIGLPVQFPTKPNSRQGFLHPRVAGEGGGGGWCLYCVQKVQELVSRSSTRRVVALHANPCASERAATHPFAAQEPARESSRAPP